ncbi:hypothetical protein [Oceanobacillus profundus]|uniref:Uncharacterized protein n=1 Tax=Oceanobacillus profundus TaxID=372463 RepID=A0A417YLX0_9BACI|nr:hypothetical protein [Oceanobacillus profundus]MBR3120490.1 hypothetical protein [Oceanobacillus sp.]MDO6449173.1 hypothetical protein [Oceanobacillus profundus]RHW34497.1 hypothetical protein D1B32_04865 [Oceanobacillus profundus]
MLIAVAVAGGIVIRDGAFLDGVGVLETRDGAYYSLIWCLSDERWCYGRRGGVLAMKDGTF